jgi:hypothetical protein
MSSVLFAESVIVPDATRRNKPPEKASLGIVGNQVMNVPLRGFPADNPAAEKAECQMR